MTSRKFVAIVTVLWFSAYSPCAALGSPPLSAGFAGQADDNTVAPPDVAGAVGPDHVFQFLNNGRTIYDKNGAVVAPTISIQQFWSVLGTASGQPAESVRSPRVLWDHYSGRWLVCAIGGGANHWLLVGASQTADPAGAYDLYAIQVNLSTNGFNHVNNRPDMLIMGFDPNNVVISANIFNLSFVSFVHSDVYILNKARLMAGPAGQSLVHNTDFRIVHGPCPAFGHSRNFAPCVTFGQTNASAVNYLVDTGWYDETDLGVRYFRVSRITGTGAAAVVDCMGYDNFVVTPECYNFDVADAEQPDNCHPLRAGDSRLTSPAILRNGKIWFVHAVGAADSLCADPAETEPSKAEIVWVAVDPASVGTTNVPEQYGHVSDPNLAYFYPSIAVNGEDCVLIGFSGAGPNSRQFVSCYYAVREAADPPGAVQPVAVLKAGEATYLRTLGTPINRWGTYSSACVDPADEQTLWTVQEYARPEVGGECPIDSTGRWGTWWGSISCAAPQPCSCLGDVNGDGFLDGSDISVFLDCVVIGTSPGGDCGCADFDHSGSADASDVSGFVTSLLLNSCGP